MEWLVEELEKPYDLNVRMRQFVVAVFEMTENCLTNQGDGRFKSN